MDRMLVAVFDNETEASEGKSALLDLDREGEVTVYGCAVILKHADGTASVAASEGVLEGSALGSLVALLGGPSALSSPMLVGGSFTDLHNSRVGADFIDEIATVLSPTKVGVLAELEEESTERVDARIEASGGVVLRRALTRPRGEYGKQEIDAMQADLVRLKAELAREWSDRKAKLQKQIDQLEQRILVQMEASGRRRDAAEKQHRIKRAIRANTPVVGPA
jgi:uncharacterized membrane protein